ncbi:MAG TPA: L,D-transpeptidase family protein, partial [Anaerolineae bacterium]|nr:L,D-transpeptidase family protein [Anaerolineae bacterium]
PPPAPVEPDRIVQSKSQKGSGASPAASILLGGLIGLILIVCVVIGGLWLFGPPQNAIAQIAPAAIAPTTATATLAPTATNTPSPTATAIPTFAPTNTTEPVQTVESTAVPTEFPTAQPTDEPTIEPTATPTDFPTAEPPVAPTLEPVATPADPGPVNTTRWIDVDLTNQVLMAYEGDNVVRSVLVSTGLPGSPTVTGQYNIYVKYPAQLMYGPGYYLPDVPWVMYFYQGYGLHGTYCHHNFGHPMSHGCVNMPTPDAEWLYNWASVGTLVNIHY